MNGIILIILLYIFGAFVIIGKDFVFFWVGDEYDMAYYYAIIIMIGRTPVLSQGFANNILEAKNLIAFRGKLLLSLTIIGTVIGVFIVKKYGVLEMIFVTIIFMFLERIFMIPYYIKKANLEMLRYYKEISPLFISTLVSIGICALINYFLPNQNILVLITNMLLYSLIYLFASYFVITKYEKELEEHYRDYINLFFESRKSRRKSSDSVCAPRFFIKGRGKAYFN